MRVTALIPYLHLVLVLLVSMRVLLRPYREPASRIAWMVVVATLPIAGVLAYLLFGEVNIGRKRVARMQKVVGHMQTEAAASGLNPQRFDPINGLSSSETTFIVTLYCA